MPIHDPQTAIREAGDLEPDMAIEIAWCLIEQRKWIPTPQLLFCLKALVLESPEYNDAITPKAISHDRA